VHDTRGPEDSTLNTSLAEVLSVVLLLAVLACAVIRPFGWPEAVVAVPAAAVVLGTGRSRWTTRVPRQNGWDR
jgi:arsenical pump membrane protein